MKSPIHIRIAKSADILDLRHAILRAGLPREAARFDGDDEPTTRHVVAEIDQKIVGCVTIMRRAWDNQPAWQLRGMAIDPSLQRTGIGSMLLAEIDRIVLDENFSMQLWCNARTPAVRFYEKHGWSVVSDVFVIETAGPHVKMTKTL